MILDTSAILAILFREPGSEALQEKALRARALGVGAPTLTEAGFLVTARRGGDAGAALLEFLDDLGVMTIPFGEAHWRVAIEAFRRFGKGRHPAALNFGDCLAYATARVADMPLLCVGDDFAKTDLPLA